MSVTPQGGTLRRDEAGNHFVGMINSESRYASLRAGIAYTRARASPKVIVRCVCPLFGDVAGHSPGLGMLLA